VRRVLLVKQEVSRGGMRHFSLDHHNGFSDFIMELTIWNGRSIGRCDSGVTCPLFQTISHGSLVFDFS
jgi:hypothetical protein